MRSLIVALVLAVSPLGPSVCEVVCGAHGAEHETATAATSCHGDADATGPVIDHDHDCTHPDQVLAIVRAGSAPAVDLVAIGPVTLVARTTMIRVGVSILAACSLSPPHSPPILSLRI